MDAIDNVIAVKGLERGNQVELIVSILEAEGYVVFFFLASPHLYGGIGSLVSAPMPWLPVGGPRPLTRNFKAAACCRRPLKVRGRVGFFGRPVVSNCAWWLCHFPTCAIDIAGDSSLVTK